ncbi:MAG: ribosomal protein S18-alanine N-acetyltransferase [Halanaerobium sp.]|nr:ribosomal protein S18-alanine N-acetyltransferase [Halanaerobium sp.]
MFIDLMQVDDLEEILEIEKESFPSAWSRKAFLFELTKNPYGLYLTLRDEGMVAGYIGAWFLMNYTHITNLAVRESFRGKGYATNLIREIFAQARLRGSYNITLEVRRSNLAAQRLYEKLGFQIIGVKEGYYRDNREDALVMWKSLS